MKIEAVEPVHLVSVLSLLDHHPVDIAHFYLFLCRHGIVSYDRKSSLGHDHREFQLGGNLIFDNIVKKIKIWRISRIYNTCAEQRCEQCQNEYMSFHMRPVLKSVTDADTASKV